MNTSYTKEQISQLEAGPELDRLVAEHVMGLQNIREGWQSSDGVSYYYSDEPGDDEDDTCLIYDDEYGRPAAIPSYCEDIYSAFQVVDKMVAGGWFHKHQAYGGTEIKGWFWTFMRDSSALGIGLDAGKGETAPLAICRAALKSTLGL